MKKVGIITLNGYFNYGNRLQNYALEETIKLLGYEVETIIAHTNAENKLEDRIKSFIENSPKQMYNLIIGKLIDIISNSNKKRGEVFENFTFQYINEKRYPVINDTINKKYIETYDYFITGSDQVWNPSYINDSSINFLTFASKNKRIAYSPSFGISKIPEEYEECYEKWISDMYRLSVREDDGAKIIKELTGRNAPVLVDPTLLLTREKWLSIAEAADNKPKDNYLLTYFLGGTPPEYEGQIKKIIEENNLDVINMGDIRESETYQTGPCEFIDYINSCSVFCTDSFHGAVFSILLGKPFIIYERMGTSSSMFSRIETLLDKFNLHSRKASEIKSNRDVFNIEYSHVPEILEYEREKSFEYLKEALNIKGEVEI